MFEKLRARWLGNVPEPSVPSPAHATVLNYLWINKEPDKADFPQGVKCSVPFSALDKAYENAARYHDAKVNIWLDFDQLNESSFSWIKRHFAQRTPGNVRIRDLNTIEAYEAAKEFDDFDGRPIDARVDMARLMVLMKSMGESARGNRVIYSDFDVPDVGLNRPDLDDCMNNQGLVIGATLTTGQFMENGYLGFNATGENFARVEKLLGDTLVSLAETSDVDGFPTLRLHAEEWAREFGVDEAALTVKIQPVSGTPMEHDPQYDGINPP